MTEARDELDTEIERAILGPLVDLPVVKSDVHAAMRRFGDEMEASIRADFALARVVEIARAIADYARTGHRWTRKRLVRERKRWNRMRRRR